MKAKDVYNIVKPEIEILIKAMRNEGRPGHVDTHGILVTSYQPFEPELTDDSSTVVAAEMMGIHTSCQVMPFGDNDSKMVCVQGDRRNIESISKCVGPISLDIVSELYDLSTEYQEVLLELIPKVINKKMTVDEASNILNTRLSKNLRQEKEVVNHYIEYRNKHCGKTNYLTTKIYIKDGKIIEV